MSSKSSMQSTKLARQVMRRCLNDVHKAAAIILFIGISNVFISDIGFKRPLSHWVNTASVLLKLWIVLVSNIFCYNSEIFIVEVMSQCFVDKYALFPFSSMRAIFVWFPGIVSLYGYRHLRFRWDSPFRKLIAWVLWIWNESTLWRGLNLCCIKDAQYWWKEFWPMFTLTWEVIETQKKFLEF